MKKKAHGFALAAAIAVALSSPAPAQAQGIPTIDVASIIQQIQQVEHMVTQIKHLENQLNQARQQYEALTGGRGMENLLRDQNYNSIPTSWQETLAMMEGGSEISALARSIKENASRIDTATLDRLAPVVRELHEQQANSVASEQAAAGTVYDSASERFGRLEALMDAIPQATDLKAINDLQARIQAEQVMLQNEQIKMQALAQIASSQRGLEDQQVREELLKANSGTGAFPPLNSWVRSRR